MITLDFWYTTREHSISTKRFEWEKWNHQTIFFFSSVWEISYRDLLIFMCLSHSLASKDNRSVTGWIIRTYTHKSWTWTKRIFYHDIITRRERNIFFEWLQVVNYFVDFEFWFLIFRDSSWFISHIFAYKLLIKSRELRLSLMEQFFGGI